MGAMASWPVGQATLAACVAAAMQGQSAKNPGMPVAAAARGAAQGAGCSCRFDGASGRVALSELECALTRIAGAMGLRGRVALPKALIWLRGKGASKLASCVSALFKFRDGVAHPDVQLLADLDGFLSDPERSSDSSEAGDKVRAESEECNDSPVAGARDCVQGDTSVDDMREDRLTDENKITTASKDVANSAPDGVGLVDESAKLTLKTQHEYGGDQSRDHVPAQVSGNGLVAVLDEDVGAAARGAGLGDTSQALLWGQAGRPGLGVSSSHEVPKPSETRLHELADKVAVLTSENDTLIAMLVEAREDVARLEAQLMGQPGI
eukprot:NODE_1539_length_1117_cov_250.742938.p1 GENE.NODE_1539_length_1117_cov_250.742938~~NODE_1539_length_1117_cov_250.742938.p1  ORF type:complete len:323 (+),score=71.82 NODE_1539_length_1117_cov_250.742938:3-971(+)